MKISIITPSFNQGRFITDCLESVRSQVAGSGFCPPEADLPLGETSRVATTGLRSEISVEHIVIDGGSGDDTVAILAAWSREISTASLRHGAGSENTIPNTGHHAPGPMPYSFCYTSSADEGQTDAINKGLERATGDILAYLCSDDFYEPGALAAVAEVFEKHPEVEVVYGDYFFLEGDSGWKRPKKAGSFSQERLLRDNFLGQPSVFWRRRVYEKFGALDKNLRFCMDHEYWLRISGGTDWFYLEQPLAVCRLHASAKTSRQLAPAWWETARMAKRYGQGFRFFWKALAMQMIGQWLYLTKRLVFKQVGRVVK